MTGVLSLMGLLMGCTCAFAGRMRLIETQHYRIYTDIDNPFAHQISQRLDMMYDEYARRLAGFGSEAPQHKLLAYLFKRHDDYNAFTQNRAENSGGVFMPERHVLAAYYEGEGRDGLRRTLQHEAFHQFAYHEISRNLPPWLNEGLAVLFEEGIWVGDQFELGEVPPRRVRQLNADLAGHRLTDFRQFMSMNNDRWTELLNHDPSLGAAQYNQAWAMVHFLVFAREDGHYKYRGRFIRMLHLIHKGMSAQAAFETAFGNNISGFQSRFLEYVSTLKPTPRATLIEHQETLGDLLIQLNRMGKRYDSIDEFRKDITTNRYRLRYTKGEVRWSSDIDPHVYFTGPDGQPLSDDELYFDPRSGAPLPDLVYRGPGDLEMRMKFYDLAGTVHHELILEPTDH